MTSSPSRRMLHPAGAPIAPLRLYGRRIMMRPLVTHDFEVWSEVRRRNANWLLGWEPRRSEYVADPVTNREAFERRCVSRDRERQAGTAYTLGMFVNNVFVGEVNLNNVIRGAMQTGTVGYWIDRQRAGHGYVVEGVVVLAQFAFEDLNLHRLEVCVIPRNTNSRRVMEKLDFRLEGLAERFLEINGVWEDHLRYAFTSEEWHSRKSDMRHQWLTTQSGN